MQRHPQENQQAKGEVHPLLRHISMEEQESFHEHEARKRWRAKLRPYAGPLLIVALFVVLIVTIQTAIVTDEPEPAVPVDKAHERMLNIGNNLEIWYRTWGNRETGIPVLFVHGGPGNCIADYGNGNARFFDYQKFFVVEVDQRGTGRSLPSVRDDCRNMKYYTNITVQQMSHDFELIRHELRIDQWLVFGGSWGSTLSLDYVERYPSRCLGLIVRGVWLNTRPEFEAIFTRRVYRSNQTHLKEFDTWFELAAQEAKQTGGPKLDPNDAERFFRIYGKMIQQCDKNAIWRHYVWEYNMMEEDPAKHLDPYNITQSHFPEAMSVAFFENRIYLHHTFDEPMDLLGYVDKLKSVNVWICQGLRDKVCPAKYGAEKLASALVAAGVSTRSQFLDAGHEDTDPVIAKCLKDSVHDFLSTSENQS